MITNFPKNRYMHVYNVGRRMFDYSKDVFGWNINKCKEMFVLGSIHDIGYELNPNPFLHDIELASTLSGYKYVNEIKYHSKLTDEYSSQELDLLYFADQCVDGQGYWCTFDERLKDIEKRYGISSEVYIATKNIIDYCTEKGFDSTMHLHDDLHIMLVRNYKGNTQKALDYVDSLYDLKMLHKVSYEYIRKWIRKGMPHEE